MHLSVTCWVSSAGAGVPSEPRLSALLNEVSKKVRASLDLHIRRSNDAARKLDAIGASHVHRIQTDGRSPTDMAAEIIACSGW